MSDTTLYYCGGTKPLLELMISIYTLRKHNKGNVTVLLGEGSEKYCDNLKEMGVELITVPDTKNDRRVQDHWSSRWRGMPLCKHDRVLHLDCDTTIAHNYDHLFDLIHPDPEYITSYYMWQKHGTYHKWKMHLNDYQKVTNIADDADGLYFGFGLVGWNKGWPHFQKVADYAKKLPTDEMSMSLTLIENGRKGHMPPNMEATFRCVRAYYRLTEKEFDDTLIWHYPQKGIQGFYQWWEIFFKAREEKAMGLHDDAFIEAIHPTIMKILKTGTYPKTNNKGKGVDPKKLIAP